MEGLFVFGKHEQCSMLDEILISTEYDYVDSKYMLDKNQPQQQRILRGNIMFDENKLIKILYGIPKEKLS